ncbi:protein bassoon isoform X5 [Phycodurus eques]|uniref:protein bassoon isoform X5 n=1 Tax=Phycodurus eques TaxID=693459 RepID=UPI002ACD60CF|nr:protein bassoon isoform X5 [Phycodurus eques]
MGNEASMEGEGQAGQGGLCAVPAAAASASISAPPDSGQLIKPSNGAPAGGGGTGPGPGINRPPAADQGPKAGIHSSHGTGDRLASHDTPQSAPSYGEQGRGHVSRKNLHVDVGSSRTGRSPSVSPDRGSVPTSPYSVPQIAPMPSSKLCPVCKTADLTGTGDDMPSFNTCTLCRSMVCNQCGFNPNPHLTEVQEWLCLNCQMQRALGMDMTTPRSKSQQQINSPSHAAKPEPKPDASSQPAPQTQTTPQTRPGQTLPASGPSKQTGAAGPGQQPTKLPPGAVPLPGMAKAPSQPDLSRNSPAHQPHHPRQDQTRSAGSSPSRQPPPPEQTFGKLFGFGASLLNQASTLISETTQPQQPPPKQAPKPAGPHGPGPGAPKHSGPPSSQQGSRAPPQQQPALTNSSKPKACCPLCKMVLNIGNTTEQPNYNTCTQCHSKVCNMCGFNPTPHLVEKKEWLCLNCQTQRALSGSLGDIPGPATHSVASITPAAGSNQQPTQQKEGDQRSGPRPTGPQQQQKPLGPQQMASLQQQQQNAVMRKVKRTLPSPPPEETPLPIVTPAQMYSSPGMPQRVLPRPAQGVTKAGLLSELKAVEQESSKLRKQQAELEEEEKEIDAKLRYLELGITQRKETMVKERERRELAYLRCMGDARDYMSDSELNNLRMGTAAATFDANGLLTRPSTAPLSQFTNDLNTTSQYSSTSSYMSYPYTQNQPSTQQPGSSYHQIGFQPPQYPSSSAPQPGTFQPHPPPGPGYQNQGTYSSRMYSQPFYQTDLAMHQHSHQAFHPPSQPMPGQSLPYPSHSSYQPGLSYPTQADILTVHQRPRQTSLADLEQKLPTNYEVISNPAVSVATSAPDTTYGSAYSNAYGQYRPSEPGLTHSGESPTSAYVSDEHYTSNLEQNIPRNYVMIDDISELTKDNTTQPTDALGHPVGGRYRSENGPGHGSTYGRPEDEPVDAYGRPTGTMGYQSTADSRTSTTVGGGSCYYDDYKHTSRSNAGSHKVSPKNLAPAVVSSKRSKHRKQGMEQKISKFSPIEEARDAEADLASYTMTTSTGGSCTVVSRSKKQDEMAYGMKRNAYDQQKYYGTSREGLEEEDRVYGSGRSRSTGYGMDKISSRDASGHRSKSYERDAMERSQRSSRTGRPPIRNQNSEEESPISPVDKPVGIGRSSAVSNAHDVRNQYGSSHSLPDVQDHHKKDLPRSHVYKPDDPYLVDDMHCAVSDSEAYHLGQEETDWFEKPREARSERSRHQRGGSQSSTGRRTKHTYHDYDEPPEEYGHQDDNHQRHSSSASSRDQRYHGNSSGRHNSSRHASEDPRSSRSIRTHPKDTSGRSDGRGTSSAQRRGGPDSRSAQGSPRNSGDFSRDSAASHQHGTGGRSQRQPGERTRRQDPSAAGSKMQQQGHSGQQRSSGQSQSGRHPGSEALDGTQQAQQQQSVQQQQQQQQQPQQHNQPPPSSQPTTTAGTGPPQQQMPKPTHAHTQGRPPGGGSAAGQPATTAVKMDATPSATSTGMKPTMAVPTIPQTTKTTPPPLTGIGSKAAPVGIGSKAGGIGNAAAGQAPPAEGENVLTKILQGGAAEQAGKLGDALSGLGKKFTSFF